MNGLTHVDLFSGIGGFALAARWAGFRTIQFVEIDPYCRAVLKKHWPEIPVHNDIGTFKWPLADDEGGRRPRSDLSARQGEEGERATDVGRGGQITLLTGGFPCQPFSVSGKRRGKEDDRFLWPEMLRVISEIRPAWVVCENVPGLVPMELDRCIFDLESETYSVQTFIIPACAVDAKHQRNRVWLVGHSERGRQRRVDGGGPGPKPTGGRSELPDPKGAGLEIGGRKRREKVGFIRACRWSTEPHVGRVAYGIPSRVDRLKALGNAIVPQVAYQIIRGIAEIEEHD